VLHVGEVPRGLGRNGKAPEDLLPKVPAVFRHEPQRLPVQLNGAFLRPPPAGLVAGAHQVADRSRCVPGLAPVVGERGGREPELRGGLLEEPCDDGVALAAVDPGKGLVGHVPDQHVLEAELLIAADA